MTDTFEDDTSVSLLPTYAGPNGLALVRSWPNDKTDPGWGGDTFMKHYLKNDFNSKRALFGYERDKWAFAFVMRSVRLVCIDIDGKNGGIDSATKLILPPTMAETSRSGNGYHLFYDMPDDTWNDEVGFAALSDRIGFVQGVDFRGTGCVFHHKQQRWNQRQPVPLPSHVYELLTAREQRVAANHARIAAVLESEDDLEVLMLHGELEARLAKPIPAGKRNNTLFAIGTDMQAAQVPNWEDKVSERADQVGLGTAEIDKLINNIGRYAVSS